MPPFQPINSRQPAGVVLCLVLVLILSGLVTYGCRADDKLFVDRAVSLRMLQQKARDCAEKGNCPKEIMNLCGLKRLHGFIIDSIGQDVVLLGQVRLKAPALHLDDMTVALRSVWGRYDSTVGNIQYHTPPGCSIDPDEQTLQQLAAVGSRLSSSGDELDKTLQRWYEVCRQEQRVSVLGVPRDTRFAKVMVDADYFMKRLVDGSETAGLDDFQSLMDMYFEKAKEELVKNQRLPHLSPYNRFWFAPGENRYSTSKSTIIISKCDVVLLTEEEYLSSSGGRVPSGGANPLAQLFAQSLSARYADLARDKPIYVELEGLFRFVALARIMRELDALSMTGLNLGYLLDQHPIRTVEVESAVMGISNVKRFSHKISRADYVETYELALPSCGGVTMDIVVNDEILVEDDSGQLAELTRTVLDKRSRGDALFWDIPAAVLELGEVLPVNTRLQPSKG